MSDNVLTKESIKLYLEKCLNKKREVHKSSYKYYKKAYLNSYDKKYLLKQRKNLFYFKKTKLSKSDENELIKLLYQLQILNNPFSKYTRRTLKNSNVNFEWLNDDDTPMCSYEIFIENLINTKQLIREVESDIVFEREVEKKIYFDSLKHIDTLSISKKKKLIKYARAENRQILLSYLFGEKIVKDININEEIEHLSQISLVNKRKIIRSFYFYLKQLLTNNSLIYDDLNKKTYLEELFQICIKYFFDEYPFESYYDDSKTENGKKKRIRKTKNTQKFNFHGIKFTYFK